MLAFSQGLGDMTIDPNTGDPVTDFSTVDTGSSINLSFPAQLPGSSPGSVGYSGGAINYNSPSASIGAPYFQSTSSGNPSGLTSFIENIVGKTAVPILNAQFGGPQPGQFFSRGPNGQTVAYALPTGASALANPFGSGFSSIPWGTLLLVGGGIFLVSMLGKK